jgi:molybdenum cofactor cytidylyltransferase
MSRQPDPSPRVAAVLLAAGGSRRMGEANKLLQEVDGEPMVARVARMLRRSAVDPVVVVTGHDAEAVEAAVGPQVVVVRNPAWGEGMGGSLAVGVGAVTGVAEGALICLGDMPAVTPATIHALVEAFRSTAPPAICVPVHRGKRGNPVLWSSTFFPELATVQGDTGARGLLPVHVAAVREVPVDDPGVLIDVDTSEALDRLRVRPTTWNAP